MRRSIIIVYNFSSRWNDEFLASFDLSIKDKKKEAKENREDKKAKIPTIKEPDIKVTKDNACAVM